MSAISARYDSRYTTEKGTEESTPGKNENELGLPTLVSDISHHESSQNIHNTSQLFELPSGSFNAKSALSEHAMLISSNDTHTIFRDHSKQQIVVIENKTKQIIHSNNSQAQFLSISPFESKILMANYNRAAIIDLSNKSQELYDSPNSDNGRLVAECCTWLSPNFLLFASANGVFSWNIGKSEQPTKICEIPNGLSYSYNGLSSNKSYQSIMISMKKSITEEYGLKKYTPCSYYSIKSSGQLINHDYVIIFDALIDEQCDLVFSIRSFPDHLLAVLRSRTSQGKTIQNLNTEVEIKLTHQNDKPLFAFKCFKRHLLYVVTQHGEVFVLDPHMLNIIATYQIANNSSLVHAYPNASDEGFIAITSDFRIIKSFVKPEFAESQLQMQITDQSYLKNLLLSGKFTSATLKILEPKLKEHLDNHEYDEAINLILSSPGQALRTGKVLDSLALLPGNNREVLQKYINIVYKKRSFNESECKWLIKESKKHTNFIAVITKLLESTQFHCSEEIGDLLFKQSTDDYSNALAVYIRSNAHCKVIGCFCLQDKFDQMNEYRNKCLPRQNSYCKILEELKNFDEMMLISVLKMLLNEKKFESLYFENILNSINSSIFLPRLIPSLLEYLHNSTEDISLYEKMIFKSLISVDSLSAVQSISQKSIFKTLDLETVKELCQEIQETEPLVALLFETNHLKIKQILQNSTQVPPLQLMIGVIEPKPTHEQIEILETLLQSNNDEKIHLSNKLVIHFHNILQMSEVASIYNRSHCQKHLMVILKELAFSSSSIETTTLYAEMCLFMNHLPELEDLIRNQHNINHESLMNTMLETQPFPTNHFIVLCDTHDRIEDLVKVLLEKDYEPYLNTFVQRINPNRLPEVVSALISQSLNDEKICNLITGTEFKYNLVQLYNVLDSFNKLELIMPTLEMYLNQNSTDPQVFTTLAMYNIKKNINPELFILTNKLFDAKAVGEYCLNYNSRLACLSYIAGEIDDEIFEKCEKFQHYDLLSDYCLSRRNKIFLKKVLDFYFNAEDDLYTVPSREIFQKQLIKSTSSSQDTLTLNFLLNCLIDFSFQNLLFLILKALLIDSQNTLISSSAKFTTLFLELACEYEPHIVLYSLKKFKGYDVDDLLRVFHVKALNEEAFEMLRINQRDFDAMKVLLYDIKDLDRALVFSTQINDMDAISELATVFLQSDSHFQQSLQLFCEAKNFSRTSLVIENGMRIGVYQDLYNYLSEARNFKSDSIIDTHIIVMMAFLGNENEIRSFLSQSNKCDPIKAGDICLENNLLNAAQVLYHFASNFAKLALVLIQIGNFQKAIECAEKANDNSIWYKVSIDCLCQGEYQSSMYATSKVFKANYNVNELISIFESYGKFDMLCSCLEDATNYVQSQSNIFQHFISALAKYKSNMLEQAIMVHHTKLESKTDIIKILMNTGNYKEASLLDELSQNYDSSVEKMLDYPAQAWKHSKLLQLVTKLTQESTFKTVLNFYINYLPELLSEVYQAMLVKLDHGTLLSIISDFKYLILDILESKYTTINDKDVNNSLIAIYSEIDEKDKLRDLLMTNDNYSPHLIPSSWGTQFADIQVITLRQAKKYKEAFKTAKENGVLNDVLNIIKESKDLSLINEIIEWLVTLDDKSYFLAALAFSFEDFGLSQAWKVAFIYDCESLITPFAISKSIQLEEKVNSLGSKSNLVNGNKNFSLLKSSKASPFKLTYH